MKKVGEMGELVGEIKCCLLHNRSFHDFPKFSYHLCGTTKALAMAVRRPQVLGRCLKSLQPERQHYSTPNVQEFLVFWEEIKKG